MTNLFPDMENLYIYIIFASWFSLNRNLPAVNYYGNETIRRIFRKRITLADLKPQNILLYLWAW